MSASSALPDDDLSGTDDQSYEVQREHHRRSLFDMLDALHGPLDRRAVQRLAAAGGVELNGEPVGPSVTLRTGDVVTLQEPIESLGRDDTRRAVRLLLEDGDLVVGCKPSGLAFDTSRHGTSRSALELLRDQLTTDARLRPVHRLDKDTSGVVVTARGQEAEKALIAALKAGEAHVEYLTVVRGHPGDEGEIDVPLGKRKKSDAQLIPDEGHGFAALTRWTCEERLRGFSILRLRPLAGRSHQVRAHLAQLGFPALCDAMYGEDDRLLLSQLKIDYRPKRGRPERPVIARPVLHASAFQHGETRVEAELPDDLSVLLAQLRRLRPLR